MNNAKTTRKALLTSVVALVICVTMLMGTTFAWFTDTATVAVNTIKSGNLKIDLISETTNTSVKGGSLGFVKENGTAIDNSTILWEPGCRYVLEPVTLVNKGNLWAKYTVSISGVNGIVNDGNSEYRLTDVIEVYEGEVDPANLKGTLSDVLLSGKTLTSGVLAPSGEEGAEQSFAGNIILVMKDTADNNYQNLTIEDVSVTVLATQYTYEEDSFNNQYDAGASFPLLPNEKRATNNEELAEILANLEGVDTIYLGAGQYNIPGIYQNWGAYELSIIGAVNTDGTPATVMNITQDTLWGLKGTVKNITFKDSNNKSIVKFMDGNGLHADVVVDNCVFDGASMQFTGIATVKNSVFNGNDAAWSGIQYSAPGGDIVIDNCEFSGYTFTNLQVTDEGAHKDVTVTVSNCKIGAMSENAVSYAEGVTLYVDSIVIENNIIDCNVWTPSFANVTKTNNATSSNDEVSYRNW